MNGFGKIEDYSQMNASLADQNAYERQLDAGYVPNQTVSSEASGLMSVNLDCLIGTERNFFASAQTAGGTDSNSSPLLNADSPTNYAQPVCSNSNQSPNSHPSPRSLNQQHMLQPLPKQPPPGPRIRAKRGTLIDPSLMRRSNRLLQCAADSPKTPTTATTHRVCYKYYNFCHSHGLSLCLLMRACVCD